MDILFTILILISFAFGILSIVGLISPTKGGFWLVFIKEKKRIKVFGLNLLASFIILIISGIILPTNYYQKGVRELNDNNFTQAREAFNEIKVGNEHYESKDDLVKNVYTEAKELYRSLIQEAIESLDKDMANKNNNAYKDLSGEFVFEESYITDKISKNIDMIKNEINNLIKVEDFDDALNKVVPMVNKMITKEYAEDKITQINNIRIAKTKTQIELKIHEKEYIEAQKLADSLMKYSQAKDYVLSVTDNISPLLKEQLKAQTSQSLEDSDLDSAKAFLTYLSRLGGEEGFVTSNSNYIKEMEVKIEFDAILQEVNSYVQSQDFDNARTSLNDLIPLGIEESRITNLTEQINGQEEKFIAHEKERKEEEYKNNATRVSHADILRYPDKYQGKIVSLRGKVIKKDSETYVISTKYVDYLGYMGDNVVFTYTGSKRTIEGDYITIYGNFTGISNYIFGGETPKINVKVLVVRVPKS